MQKSVISFICLLTANAFAADLSFKNISENEWRFVSEGTVRITKYDSRFPPQLAFPIGVSECTLGGKPCGDGKLVVPQNIFSSYEVELKYTDQNKQEKKLKIEMLGKESLEVKIEGRSVLNKSILFANNSTLRMLGPDGQILYFQELPHPVLDFKQHNVKNSIYYSYFEIVKSNDFTSEGYRIILNDKFEPVARLDRLTDLHEFLMIDRNHYIFSVYEPATMISGSCLVNQKAVELKNGKIVNEFSFAEFLKKGYIADQFARVPYKGKDCLKGVHLNAIIPLKNKRWLISFGDSSIFQWNLKTRKADWIFLGKQSQFLIAKDMEPKLHHTPNFFPDTGRIVLFDNALITQKSRILEYRLDFQSKNLVSEKEHSIGNAFAKYGGNVAVDEGNVFSVGFGKRMAGEWDFAEFKDGKRTMAIKLYADKEQPFFYRIYRGSLN